MMLGQMYEQEGKIDDARTAYTDAVTNHLMRPSFQCFVLVKEMFKLPTCLDTLLTFGGEVRTTD